MADEFPPDPHAPQEWVTLTFCGPYPRVYNPEGEERRILRDGDKFKVPAKLIEKKCPPAPYWRFYRVGAVDAKEARAFRTHWNTVAAEEPSAA